MMRSRIEVSDTFRGELNGTERARNAADSPSGYPLFQSLIHRGWSSLPVGGDNENPYFGRSTSGQRYYCFRDSRICWLENRRTSKSQQRHKERRHKTPRNSGNSHCESASYGCVSRSMAARSKRRSQRFGQYASRLSICAFQRRARYLLSARYSENGFCPLRIYKCEN